MEFDELQQIWNKQNNQVMYTINEQEVQQIIEAKRDQALHITDTSELLLVIVNLGAGIFTLWSNSTQNISIYVMSVWMLATAGWVLFGRIRRIKNSGTFDRSLLGELQHAASVATYQVRLSSVMRLNVLPIGILILMAVWEGGKPAWVTLLVVILFGLAYKVGGWEHGIYKSRRQEIEALLNKLKGRD